MDKGTKLIFAITFLFSVGCGVKGDPQPPSEMPSLGKGKPTFDKASKELIEKEKAREEKIKNKKRN
ncbi:MAG: hypothetical protein A4S09_14620 [Proteobacteria bacterium SG_bin7]|nr:MAG: hypothetical protein A4S09_14620 [Proteobacteria bacterium SG_bin7]